MSRFKPSPALVVSAVALFVALGGTSYAAFTVGTSQIKNGAVTTKKIKNGAVTQAKLGSNLTVANANHANTANSANSANSANNANHANNADNAGHANTANSATTAGSAPPSGPAGGDLTGTYPNPTVAHGAITAVKIGPNAVGASQLGTIVQRSATSAPIANGSSGTASVQCAAGEQVLSGGNDGFLVNGYFVVASRFEGPNGWEVFLVNETGVSRTVTADVNCLQPGS